jgi:hypothetical protein
MNTSVTPISNTLFRQAVTVAFAAINKSYWGFWLFLCLAPLALIYLISVSISNSNVQTAAIFLYSMFGLLGFCALGSNMNEMAGKMRQVLVPSFPSNFWYSALVLLSIYICATSVLFFSFGNEELFTAIATAMIAAAGGLFMTNGLVWLRSILVVGGAILIGMLIDYYFENVRNDVFLLLYGNVSYLVNSLLIALSLFFLVRWRAALTNKDVPVLLVRLRPVIAWFHQFIDIRDPRQTKNVKTGYLFKPGFMGE